MQPKKGGKTINQRKRVSFRILAFLLITAMLSGTPTAVNALEGIYHEPTGWDDLYGGTEVASNDCERYPRDPAAGGTVNTGMDAYFFTGTPKEISQKYTDVIEKPELPAVLAFGPWVSANEWDKESEVLEQVAKTNQYDIPTTAMVIEA